MIKPKLLKKGDTVAVVSPSGGAAGFFPHILKTGTACLEKDFGLGIKPYPSVSMTAEELYASPEKRAEDLNDAFADPEVSGIITSIGGNDSIRILEYLDVDLILKNPKMIMGYSDSTSFLSYLNFRGLVTYYGNSVMAGFAYLENFPDAMEEYKSVMLENAYGEIKPFRRWAQKYKNWNDESCGAELELVYEENAGHHWVNKGLKVKGRLWGGCMEILQMMNGTFAWPENDFWKDRVLFIETSEEKPLPSQVGYLLRNFAVQGILKKISALLVARPKDYTDAEKYELEKIILRIVKNESGNPYLNVISNMDFGHTDPRHILGYGAEVLVDPEKEVITYTEPLFG